MGIYLHAGWGSEQGYHNHNYYDLDHNNNHYHLDHNLNLNNYHSKSQLSKSCPQLQLLRSWWSMMRVNCRLIRRETSKSGRYWTHRWASLQTSRSSFLGRFWVGTSWIKDHLFWFWVPKDWSNIILSWRTSFRNVHSGMSTALHRANWVQQNLTSRKCSSTLFYVLMHHWLSFSRSCVMMKMTPGIDWTMSLACARIPPRCQEKRSLLAGILLVLVLVLVLS